MKFYDRKKELKVLESVYSRHGADMIIVNGRRRIGKSRLIEEFIKGKRCISVMIVPKEERQIAKDIEQEIQLKLGYSPSFETVKEALEYLFINNTEIVFLDEFPNVLSAGKSIPYELQRLWDKYKEQKETMLIISGSYASMMDKLTTRKHAPLFNRATATINLDEFRFGTVVEILNDLEVYDPEEIVRYYCVFGGVPYYYMLLEKMVDKDWHAVINALFFESGGQLSDEGENILRQEFGNAYSKYYAILEAIQAGHVSMNEISQSVGITQTTLAKYIKRLRSDFKLIYREVPFGQNPMRSKKGLYFIRDNMLSFWFSNVYGKHTIPMKGELESFMSHRFELLSAEVLVGFLEKRNETVVKAGKWWGNVEIYPGRFQQREIDLVVETEKAIYVGECKWSESSSRLGILEHLKESTNALSGKNKPIKFVIFSKSGFTKEMESIAKSEGIMLFDPKAMEKALG